MNKATVNTKFIANPNFMIASVGKQTITVGWRPRIDIKTPYDSSTSPVTFATGKYTGFCDMPLGMFGVYFGMLSTANPKVAYSPLSVSIQPNIDLRGTTTEGVKSTDVGAAEIPLNGLFFFEQFLANNPAHLTKINVRASDAAYLPSTLEILTPNSFTGQFDRQIVNVVADTNMYQNQSGIVTLDCDVFVTRYSIIRVDSAFEVDIASTPPALAMDLTFDKYLSLEKALVENYQLLQTNAGIENAIVEEVNTINAKTQDVVPVAGMPGMTVPQSQVVITSPWRRTIGSDQPVTVKGNNY